MEINKDLLKIQINNLKRLPLYEHLKKAAEGYAVPFELVLALASRETNMRDILGDLQGGEYHGVGIIQIDIQHQLARDARDKKTWQTNPTPLLNYGMGLLRMNYKAAEQLYHPDKYNWAGDRAWWKIAASAYNCGIGNAKKGIDNYNDSDKYTTGHDYGKDVMNRKTMIEEILGKK